MRFKRLFTLFLSLVFLASCAQDPGEKVVTALENAWVQFNSLKDRAEKGDMESIAILRNLKAQLLELDTKKTELEKSGGFNAQQKARLSKLANEIN